MKLLQGYISFVLGLSFCLLALGDEMVQTKYVAVGEGERHSYRNLSLHGLAACSQLVSNIICVCILTVTYSCNN